MNDRPTLPGRVLRVGVTGARELDPVQFPRLRAEIAVQLNKLAMRAKCEPEAPLRLELVTPLAEGADRLVAELSLAEGFALVCPLPFAQAEYERDFKTPESLAAFRALLARAQGRVLALDGARGDDEARSYEAVGRLVVRNCDLMVAVWNGRPAKGRGGTADIVSYAARSGPPVIWLHATDPDAQPRWIEEAHDLRVGAAPRAVDTSLALYLERLLSPPEAPVHSGHSLLHRMCHWGRTRLWAAAMRYFRGRPPQSPLVAFLSEPRRPAWGPWRLNAWMMRTMSGRNPPWTLPKPPDDAVAALWFAHYRPADERAGDNAARYRSSYVWVFALAAVALSSAAVALASADWPATKTAATFVEFTVLLLILGLVLADGLLGWHRRAIEYRLLAELCRKQQALAPLGWAVPRAGAWANSASRQTHEPDAPEHDSAGWVLWLFSAWLRDAPLPCGTIDAARVANLRDASVRDLIDDQIVYHEARRAQSHRAGRRLVVFGEVLFLLVLALVAAKLWLLLHESVASQTNVNGWLVGLGIAGAILPALSAAFVGVRSYAEMELLADQSDAALDAMRRARTQLAELDPAAPLASQALGSELTAVATMMLEDLQGWARLFRAKVVET